MAQPPLFKINKGSKGIYIKDEKELENYIIKNSKDLKKIKKGSKEYDKLIQEEKSKLNIQRFKGLGEMNPEQLWETTMNPETRTMLKVTVQVAEETDRMFETLMGEDVPERRAFIERHAKEVTNLDI